LCRGLTCIPLHASPRRCHGIILALVNLYLGTVEKFSWQCFELDRCLVHQGIACPIALGAFAVFRFVFWLFDEELDKFELLGSREGGDVTEDPFIEDAFCYICNTGRYDLLFFNVTHILKTCNNDLP
jgi:hypothetical protein